MKDLIKKLLDIVRRALNNDPDNTEEREKLRAEVAQLRIEKSEIEELTPEINELIDLATASVPATPPEKEREMSDPR